MQQQGSRMLQVTGILMIIGAGFSIITMLFALLGGTLLLGVIGAGIVLFFTLIGLASSVLQLVTGILGVKNWSNPLKAQSCIIAVAIIIALNLLTTIGNAVGGNFNFFTFVLGLLIPVLYLIGALQLKKQA